MVALCRLLLVASALTVADAINKELLRAIKDNNPSMVNIALKSGPSKAVNDVDEESGDTPLLIAVRGGKYKAVKALLKAKADAKALDKDGFTVMHGALIRECLPICPAHSHWS